MQNAYTDVFSAADFHDFVRELSRFEKARHARPHYPETLWFKALLFADTRHTVRALSNFEIDRDIQEHRAPSTSFHEKLYADPGPRMNGRPLRLLSA